MQFFILKLKAKDAKISLRLLVSIFMTLTSESGWAQNENAFRVWNGKKSSEIDRWIKEMVPFAEPRIIDQNSPEFSLISN